jgi:predicted ATP-dependent serine protease
MALTEQQIKGKMHPVRTANQRLKDAANMPDILQLFGQIWHSGELAFLFADTGIGKSIFAVQIADCLSKGKDITVYTKNENEPLTVLYQDYELSDKQFEKRYTSEFGKPYVFNDNLFIDNINFAELYTKFPKKSFTEILFEKLKQDITATNAKVLIIDNITFLHTQSTQDQQASLDIMRFLTELKKDHGLSILVLAHTPKKSENTPITISDLSGSKHLSNFADSVFCVGKSSKGSNLRYIKQIKPSRSGELIFDSNNVMEFRIEKDSDFLGYDFIAMGSEFENLNIKEDDPKLMAISLRNTNPKMSIREIAEKCGASKSSVQNWLSYEK